MYEMPEMDVIGSASELVQAYAGPYYDGGGYIFSLGLVCGPLEEE